MHYWSVKFTDEAMPVDTGYVIPVNDSSLVFRRPYQLVVCKGTYVFYASKVTWFFGRPASVAERLSRRDPNPRSTCVSLPRREEVVVDAS